MSKVIPTGIPVAKYIMVLAPVIPPPVIPVGIKKAVHPNAVRKSPNVITKYVRNILNLFFAEFVIPLNNNIYNFFWNNYNFLGL